MPKPLFSGWCVMMKPKRGAWWSATDYCGRTRKDAIRGYIGVDPGHSYYAKWLADYKRDVRNGEVKLVRFSAFAEGVKDA